MVTSVRLCAILLFYYIVSVTLVFTPRTGYEYNCDDIPTYFKIHSDVYDVNSFLAFYTVLQLAFVLYELRATCFSENVTIYYDALEDKHCTKLVLIRTTAVVVRVMCAARRSSEPFIRFIRTKNKTKCLCYGV